MFLKQSTAVDILIGPFLNKTDGYTEQTTETPSVKLSKNGQTLAAKSEATTPTHDANGYYNCQFNATDTNTLGTLVVMVGTSTNALPVRHEFQVVPAEVYDAVFGSGLAQPGQVTPPATCNLAQAISYLYKFMRNKITQDASTLKVFNDDGVTVDHKASVSDDGSTATRDEFATGP